MRARTDLACFASTRLRFAEPAATLPADTLLTVEMSIPGLGTAIRRRLATAARELVFQGSIIAPRGFAASRVQRAIIAGVAIVALSCGLDAAGQTTVLSGTLTGTQLFNAASGSATISGNSTLSGRVNFGLGLGVEYLVVGGGGATPDGTVSGGGGGGGFAEGTLIVSTGTKGVTVGQGGRFNFDLAPRNGGYSSFANITADGGGYGGGVGSPDNVAGGNGASGGGGAGDASPGEPIGWGIGNRGGNGYSFPLFNGSGGGGGAGGPGGDGAFAKAGDGGIGRASSISGHEVFYAGGGGGYAGSLSSGNGGLGGGGAGGQNGFANTGGGGGGGGRGGGSGIVILRYLGPQIADGGNVSSGGGSATGYTLHTYTEPGSSAFSFRHSELDGRLAATLSANLAGSGDLEFSGPGVLTLTGTNSYSGWTFVSGGRLVASTAASLPSYTRSGGVYLDGGTLQVQLDGVGWTATQVQTLMRNAAVNFGGLALNVPGGSQTLSGSGNLQPSFTKLGDGTLLLTGSHRFSGFIAPITVSAGTLSIGAGGSTGSLVGGHSIHNSAALVFNSSDATAYVGSISGAGSVTKAGAGTLTLTMMNSSYSGETNVNDGTLVLAGGRLLSGTDGGRPLIFVGRASGQTGVFTVQSGTVAQGATSGLIVGDSGTGTFNQTGGSVTLGSGGFSLGNGVGGVGTATFSGGVFTSTGTTTFVGARQEGTINVSGSADVTLATLMMGHQLFADTNSAVNLDGGRITVDQVVRGNGNASFVFNSGTLTARGTSTSFMTGLTQAEVKSGGMVIDTNGYSVTIGQNLSSSMSSPGGGLTKRGAGELTLTGSNSFSGSTRVVSGTLALGSAIALQGSTLDLAAGDAGGVTFTGSGISTYFLGGLQGSRNLSIGSNSLSIGAGGASTTYSGAIDGSGGLEKTGGGVLTLTGSNSYTGVTAVTAGMLSIGNGDTTGAIAGDAAVAGGATLVFSRSDAVSYAGAISGSGAVTKLGAGALVLTGSSSYTGVTVLSAGTLSLGSAHAIGSTGPISFAGGALQFTAGNTTDYSSRFSTSGSQAYQLDTNGQSVTLAAPLTSTGGALTKSGGGMLTLTGSNTYAGLTTVSRGTLAVGAGGASGSIAGDAFVASGATLAFNRSDAALHGGGISGSGGVTKLGAGTLTLTGSNSYTGATTISAGMVSLGSAGAIGSTGAISFEGGGLQFTDSNTTDYSARFSTAAGQAYVLDTNGQSVTLASNLTSADSTFTKRGAGTLTVTGSNASTGLTTVSGGTLVVGDGGTNGRIGGNAAIAGGAMLVFDRVDDQVYSGVISGSGSFTKRNAATLTLTANNTSTGQTTVSGGTLAVGDGGTSGSIAGPVAVADGAAVVFNRSDALTYAGVISGSGVVTKFGAGTLTLTGTNTSTGLTTVAGGTLQIGAGGASGSIAGDAFVASGATLAFNRSDAALHGGGISGSGGVTKLGAGTLTLTGSNSYTGATTISAGMVSLGSAGAIGSTGAISFEGGGLQFTDSNTTDYSARFSTAAGQAYVLDTNGQSVTLASNLTSADSTFTKRGAGTLTVTGSNASTGLTTVSGGTLVVGDGGTNGRIGGNAAIAGGAMLVFDRVDDQVYSGVISGSGSFTKRNAATLTLTANNTSTGQTTVSGGTLAVGDGGTSGSITGPVAVADGAAVVFNRSDALTYAGVISGSGVVTKFGAGTLTLTGTNTSTGLTTVAAGTLQIGGGADSGAIAGNVAVEAGAMLAFNRAGNVTHAGSISGSGGFIQQSPSLGTLTLTGSSSFSGPTRAASGALVLGNRSVLVGSTLDMAAGDTGSVQTTGIGGLFLIGGLRGSRNVSFSPEVSIGGNGESTVYSGQLTAVGGFVKSGSGTLSLTGMNNLGSVRLDGGVLGLGSAGAIGSSGQISFTGGTMQFSAANATDYSLRFSTAANQAFAFDTNGRDVTLQYILAGAGSTLTKSGAGTLTLASNVVNGITGLTTVAGGTLAVGNGGTVGRISGDAFVADGAALVFNRSDDVTYAGAISGAGTFTKLGSRTLTLTGNSVSTGLMTIAGGTVVIGTFGTTGAITADVSVAGGAALVFSRSDAASYAGGISGAGAVVKRGLGALTLTGSSSFSGGIAIETGTVIVGNVNALGPVGPIMLGRLYIGTTPVGLRSTVDVAHDLTVHGDGTGLVTIAGDADGITYSGGLTLARAATLGGTAAGGYAVTGRISGTVGTLTIDATRVSFGQSEAHANTFVGSVAINQGKTLELDTVYGLASGHSVTANGGLELAVGDGNTAVIGGLNGSGTVRVAATSTGLHTLSVGGNNSDGWFAGALTDGGGTLALRKVGWGTQTLTGSNTFTGLTIVSAGVLAIGAGGTSGSVNGDFVNDGELRFNRSDDTIYGGAISGAGVVTKAGAGALTLTGSSSYDGGTNLAEGTLALGSADAIGASGVISFSGGALRFTAANTADYSARFSDAAGQSYALDTGGQSVTVASNLTSAGGSLAKLGSGTLTLTGNNTYSGQTTVQVGTLRLGTGGTTGSIAGDVAVASVATLVIDRSDDRTIYTALSGTGGVTKLGTGRLTLAGNSSFTGTTTVTAGTLSIEAVTATSLIRLGTADTGANAVTLRSSVDVFGDITVGADGTGPVTIAGDGDLITFSGALNLGRPVTLGGAATDRYGYAGRISGTVGTLSIDAARVTFDQSAANANTFVGNVVVNSGKSLQLNSVYGLSGSHAVDIKGSLYLNIGDGGTATIGGLTGGGYVGLHPAAGGVQTLAVGADGSSSEFGGTFGDGGGGFALRKVGSGTLTLTGNSTQGGATTVAGGLLAIGAGGTSGGLAGDLVNDAVVRFDRSDDTTYAGLISGSGTIVKAGANTLTLTRANTFTGLTQILSGTLALGDTSALAGSTLDLAAENLGAVAFAGPVPGTYVLGGLRGSRDLDMNTASLSVGANGASTEYAGQLSGAGGLTKLGSGTLVLSGSNSYSGGTRLDAGTLRAVAPGALPGSETAGAVVFNGGTLELAVGGTGWTMPVVASLLENATKTSGALALDVAAGSETLAAGVSGGIGLTKRGAGTLVLGGSNAFTGLTRAASGTLVLGNAAALAGSTLDLAAGDTGAVALSVPGTTTSILGGLQGARNLALGGNSVAVGSNGANTTYAGGLSGSGGLTKIGVGELVLTGSNSFAGRTTLAEGVLVLGHQAALGGGGPISFTGGAVRFTADNTADYGSRIRNSTAAIGLDTNGQTVTMAAAIDATNTGGLTKLGDGTLVLSGSNSYSGGTRLDAGTLRAVAPGALPGSETAGAVVFNGGTLELAVGGTGWTMPVVASLLENATKTSGALALDVAAGSETLAAGVSGGIGLTKRGAGTLVLGGSNAFTGLTRAASGTLVLGNAAALAGSTLDLAAGDTGAVALSVPGTTTSILGGLQGARNLALGGNSVAVGSNGANTTYAGGLSGSGGLTKIGVGELVLTGSNSFAGRTTLAEGVLVLGHQAALGGGGPISFTGGAVRFTADNTADYGSRIRNSTAAIGLDTNGQTVTMAAAIDATNTGGLTKLGDGTLVLSGSNSYSGGTRLVAGNLAFGTPAALAGAGPISFAGGAVQFTTDGTVAFGEQIRNSTSAVLLDTNGFAVTLAGSVDATNSGGLVKRGDGTLTLSAANAFTGVTRVSQGVLSLEHTEALAGSTLELDTADGGGVVFGGPPGGTYTLGGLGGGRDLDIGSASIAIGANGDSTTYSGQLSGAGQVNKAGAGTLVLAGNNTYAGGTRLVGGTLVASSAEALPGYETAGQVVFAGGALGLTVDDAGWTTPRVDALLANATKTSGLIALDVYDDRTLAGGVDGGIGLTKLGMGSLTLGGSNSFTGTTRVGDGRLALGDVAALAGSTLDLTGGDWGELGLDVPGAVTYFLGGLRGSRSLDIGENSVSIGSNGQSTVYDGELSGVGGLIKTGAGTLELAGNNWYLGGTRLDGGTLRAASAAALPQWDVSDGIVFNGGTLDLAFDGVSWTAEQVDILLANATKTAGVLSLDVADGEQTLAGGIAGDIGLTKRGIGALVLSENNSYAGTTALVGGTLRAVAANALPGQDTAGRIVFDGGTLEMTVDDTAWTMEQVEALLTNATKTRGAVALDVGGAQSLNGSTLGSLGLTKLGAGILTLTGTDYTGLTRVVAGTLALEDTSALAGSTLDLDTADGGSIVLAAATDPVTYTLGGLKGGRDLDVGANSLIIGATGTTTAYAGRILGSGSLTKTGTGMLTLAGENQFTGDTTVAAGRLAVNGSVLAPVTVLTNADLGGSGTIVGAVAIQAGGTLSPGNSIESLLTGTATFAAAAVFAAEVDSTNLGALGTAADLLVINGDLNLDPGNGTILGLTDLAVTPQLFASYTTSFALLNYSGSWNGGLFTLSGTVLQDGDRFFTGTQQWQIDYDRTSSAGLLNFTSDYLLSGRFVSITAVPEPSAVILALIGLCGCGYRLLRRRC